MTYIRCYYNQLQAVRTVRIHLRQSILLQILVMFIALMIFAGKSTTVQLQSVVYTRSFFL